MKHEEQAPLSKDEQQLFRESVAGAKSCARTPSSTARRNPRSNRLPAAAAAGAGRCQLLFSDEYQPQLEEEGPTRYVRPGSSPYELKKLRRGDYSPELFLDLHGLTQLQAKQELGR